MSDTLERAREAMDSANENDARKIAIVISILAAGLALAEMQEKGAQNAYLTTHIAVSDDYAFYQSKKARALSERTAVAVLQSLPNATDPLVAQRIADAQADAARMEDDPGKDGAKQLFARAETDKISREENFHRYELFEMVVGALQIAIVLASVAVVTRIRTLAFVAGGIGLAAIVAGVLVFARVI